MDELITDVVDRLREARSTTWLRIIDDARLDEPVSTDADAAVVVEPYRWFLERIGGGVTLTQAGWLPPALVLETMETLDWQDRWIGKHNREDQTWPVLHLRESARQFGLVRKYRGTLLPTKAGRGFVTDPDALWWHLASRLPDAQSKAEQQAGVLALLQTAAGRSPDGDLLAAAMGALGWAEGPARAPLSAARASALASGAVSVFETLGLRPKRRWNEPEPPPPAVMVELARAALVGRSPGNVVTPARGTSPAGPQQAVELTITLRDIEPPIWRRLVVPAALTLRQTHEVIQTAMGWLDYHLHMFDVGGTLYGDVEDFDGPLGKEDTFTLGDARAVAPEFSYEYDFGDGWTHDVRLGAVTTVPGPVVPHLVDGARACPPEDSGGPWSYPHLLEVLADPQHEEHAHLLDWTGGGFDPEALDLAAINANLELFDRHTRRR